MKKIFMFIALAIISLTMTGCFTSFDEVEWIEFVNSFDAVYRLNDSIDLSQITVKVKYTDGDEEILNASNSAIVVTGVDTSSVGVKIARVTYRSISITAQYEVIPNTNFNAADPGAITAFTEELKEDGKLTDIVIEGVFTGKFTIERPVRIVGVNGAKIIGGFTIDNTDDNTNNIAEGTISFKNLKMEAPSASVGTGNGISLSGGLSNSIDINVDACEFKNFDIGVIIAVKSGANIKAGTEKTIGNLTVKDTFFNNNTYKGLYLEGANNISITGTTFNSNATIGKTGDGYATRIACDINLKYATYNSLLIENSRFVNNGVNPSWSGQYVNDGYTVTPYTAALGIKVRNDAGSYHDDGTRNVAVLNNVVIRNNRFENNINGIYFGEPKTATIFNEDGTSMTDKVIPGVNEIGDVSLSGNIFVNNYQADIINCTTNTSIRSVVNSVEGLNNAILYSSTENITIVNKSNSTVNLENYEGYLVDYNNGKYYFVAERTFDNLTFVTE